MTPPIIHGCIKLQFGMQGAGGHGHPQFLKMLESNKMIHIFIEERFSYNLNYEITVVTMVHIYDTKCTIKILGKKTGRNHPCVTPFTTRYNIENLNF